MNSQIKTFYSSAFVKDTMKLASQQPRHFNRCKEIISQLQQGMHYSELGGKPLRSKPGIVRFKLGQRYRLLTRQTDTGWLLINVISHERYNKFLSRRG